MIDFSRPIDNEEIIYPPFQLPGLLSIPAPASGLVIFAHGRGSSRFSPRKVIEHATRWFQRYLEQTEI